MWHEQAGETNFAVNDRGDLKQNFIGGPGDYAVITVPGSEGRYKPNCALTISRPTYNPDNPYHRIFDVSGPAMRGDDVVTFRWLGDRWEGYGG